MSLTDDENARLARLRQPFFDEEVDWRMDRVSNGKVTLLAYLDSRAVQDRLDEAFGPEGWKNELKIVETNNATHFISTVSIWLGGQWVSKTDAAGHRKMHGQGAELHETKAGASDAFKRACSRWGMGRNLYDLGVTRAPLNQGWAPRNVPKHTICIGKGKQAKTWCHVPSIRGMQRHLVTLEQELQSIKDPTARRLARYHSIFSRLGWGFPPNDRRRPELVEASTATFRDNEFVKEGSTLPPNELGADVLHIGSQRAARWFNDGEVDVKMAAYQAWKKTNAAFSPEQTRPVRSESQDQNGMPWPDQDNGIPHDPQAEAALHGEHSE